jgi:ketosteroid isomerase-like protein
VTALQTTPTDVVRELLAAVDGGDLAAVAAIVTNDVHLRFGNVEPTDGKADFIKTTQAVFGSIAGIRHDILDIWEVEAETVVAVMDVHYTRLDGGELTLPCCNTFRLRDGLVHDYRVYMDITPVLAP